MATATAMATDADLAGDAAAAVGTTAGAGAKTEC